MATIRGTNPSVPDLIHGKYCYYIPETQDPTVHGGYVPSIVIEDEGGHYPMLGSGPHAAPWVWGMDLEIAQEVCRKKNAALGLSDDRVQQIITSSMWGMR